VLYFPVLHFSVLHFLVWSVRTYLLVATRHWPLVTKHFLFLPANAKNIDEANSNNCCGNAQPEFGVMLFEDLCGLIAEIDRQPTFEPKSDSAAESQCQEKPPYFHAKYTGRKHEEF
jgi:hypothetical protein